ncbi:hypothetical protein EON65_41325, partial [archaeon]
MTSTSSIDTSVSDFFSAAVDAIITDRKASIVPLSNVNMIHNPTLPLHSKPSEPTEYIKCSLYQHKRDLQKPLFLDIYLYHPSVYRYIHIERWCMTYTYTPSSDRDNRPLPVIARRLHILLRSVYCFVRLLPGFNLLHLPSSHTQTHSPLSPHTQTHTPSSPSPLSPSPRPSIAFQLHNQKDMPVRFTPSPPSSYTFP